MTQIFDNTENLIKFVNNILDISKLEAGRMAFTYKTFSHKNTIGSLLENFMTLYAQKSISLTLTDETKHDSIQ
jgi:K+-sensing histidine kinase KdpD